LSRIIRHYDFLIEGTSSGRKQHPSPKTKKIKGRKKLSPPLGVAGTAHG